MADKEKPAKSAAGESPKAEKGAQGAQAAKGGKSDKQGRDKKGAAPKTAAAPAAPRPKDYRPRMKSHYEKVVRETLTKKFAYKNQMQVPKLEKIVLNMGVGEELRGISASLMRAAKRSSAGRLRSPAIAFRRLRFSAYCAESLRRMLFFSTELVLAI